jgi:fermentation-respiration switch protein FrsA (DUF1100 family)
MIRNREFEKVVAQLDSSMAARLDTSRLRKSWDNILKVAGNYKSTIRTSSDHQPNFDVVIQHCQFEKKKIDFKMVYGSDKKIKGISFLSGEPKEVYTLPDYNEADKYSEKHVLLKNGPIELKGILTLPDSIQKPPLVILIHGSGPNDKDETIGPTKIFKDLSVGLGSKGIAVYRYEKRNRVYATKMAKDVKYTINEETIDDAIAAFKLFKEDSLIDNNSIYFCGHGIGGTMLPRIAEKTPGVKGLIFLTANARPLEDMLFEQTLYVLSLDTSGRDFTNRIDSIKIERQKIKELKETDLDTTLILSLPRPYWIDLNKYNHIQAAQKINLPMLFMNGERDYQVTSVDFEIWKNGLKDKKAEFIMYKDLNHFFIKGVGKGTPAEYVKKGNVDEVVIKDLVKWILSGKK